MSVPIIYKGGDNSIQVTLKINGTAVPISDLSNIFAYCYQTKNEIIQTWKLSDNSITVIDNSGGIVQINLDRDNTINAACKRIFLEVVMETISPDFESGFARIVTGDIVLCDLKNSVGL